MTEKDIKIDFLELALRQRQHMLEDKDRKLNSTLGEVHYYEGLQGEAEMFVETLSSHPKDQEMNALKESYENALRKRMEENMGFRKTVQELTKVKDDPIGLKQSNERKLKEQENTIKRLEKVIDESEDVQSMGCEEAAKYKVRQRGEVEEIEKNGKSSEEGKPKNTEAQNVLELNKVIQAKDRELTSIREEIRMARMENEKLISEVEATLKRKDEQIQKIKNYFEKVICIKDQEISNHKNAIAEQAKELERAQRALEKIHKGDVATFAKDPTQRIANDISKENSRFVAELQRKDRFIACLQERLQNNEEEKNGLLMKMEVITEEITKKTGERFGESLACVLLEKQPLKEKITRLGSALKTLQQVKKTLEKEDQSQSVDMSEQTARSSKSKQDQEIKQFLKACAFDELVKDNKFIGLAHLQEKYECVFLEKSTLEDKLISNVREFKKQGKLLAESKSLNTQLQQEITSLQEKIYGVQQQIELQNKECIEHETTIQCINVANKDLIPEKTKQEYAKQEKCWKEALKSKEDLIAELRMNYENRLNWKDKEYTYLEKSTQNVIRSRDAELEKLTGHTHLAFLEENDTWQSVMEMKEEEITMLRTSIQDCQKALGEFAREMEERKKKYEENVNLVDKLSSQNQFLKDRLKELEETFDRKEREIESKRVLLEEEKQRLCVMERDVIKISEDLEQKEKQNEVLVSALKKAKEQVNKVQEDNREATVLSMDDKAKLQSQIDKFQNILKEKDELLLAASKQNDNLRIEMRKVQEVESNVRKIAETYLKALNRDKSVLIEKANVLEEKLRRITEDNSELKGLLKCAEFAKTYVSNEVGELKKLIYSKESKLVETFKSVEALEKENQMLEFELKNYYADWNREIAEKNKISHEFEQLKDEVLKERSQVEGLLALKEDNIKEVEKYSEELRNKNEDLKLHLEDAVERLGKEKNTRSFLQKEIRKVDADNKSLKRDNEILRNIVKDVDLLAVRLKATEGWSYTFNRLHLSRSLDYCTHPSPVIHLSTSNMKLL